MVFVESYNLETFSSYIGNGVGKLLRRIGVTRCPSDNHGREI